MENELDKALNVAPAPEVPVVQGEIVSVAEQPPAILEELSDEKEVDENFRYARENIKELLEQGKDVFNILADIS